MSDINKPAATSYFAKPLEDALAPYSTSKMGPKQVLKLLQDASTKSEKLQFVSKEEESEFFIGLSQLTKVVSNLFDAFKKGLFFKESEEFNLQRFNIMHEKATGIKYILPDSRLFVYQVMMQNSFTENFGYLDRMNTETYNKNTAKYNEGGSNIINNINEDYDSATNTFLDDDFKGLNLQIVKDFFITMKSTLPETLPLIDDSKYHAAVDNAKKDTVKALSN